MNFAVAMAIPRLTRRFGGTLPLVAGVALTLAGMSWLSRLTASSGYVTDIALPMLLVGAGQGLAFAPLTSSGIAGATAQDAGAASGLVNTFHQVGMSLGLGVLVAVAAHAPASSSTAVRLAGEVGAAFTAGSAFLALSLVVALALILPATARRRPAPAPAASPAVTVAAES